MHDNARFRRGVALFFLFFIGVYPCSSVANSAEPGPVLEPPLPSPRRLPAGPPVEEPAPAPREIMGPVGPTPPGLSHEEAAPMPREQTPAPPRLLLPSMSRSAPAAEAQRLHQEIEGLRMEREAMLLEEMDLITAKELKAGKGDEASQLRQRITELLLRVAQREKAKGSGEQGRLRAPKPGRTGSRPRPRTTLSERGRNPARRMEPAPRRLR